MIIISFVVDMQTDKGEFEDDNDDMDISNDPSVTPGKEVFLIFLRC